MAQLTGQRRIAHLLRRAGFGGSPEEIEAHAQMGFDAAVDQLVNFEGVPNDRVDSAMAQMESEQDLTKLATIQNIWLYRMLNTARPLEEKMTLFWHNHFATANYKVNSAPAMYQQNGIFRTHALGNFRELLYAVSRDPAMLRWLDSNTNRKGNPNENYSRELMELFTMGVGNYSEQDVREAARAFTGWFYRQERGTKTIQFVFNRGQHDVEDKTVLGSAGAWDGNDIIDIILDHPATAEHMARRFFTFFVHGQPAPGRISAFADELRRSGYDVRKLVESIFRSPEFSSEEAYHALVKSPIDYLIGAMKAVGVGEFGRTTLAMLNRMGMSLFNPPNVAGWDWGTDWISSATWIERLNAANTLTTQRGNNARFGMDPTALVERLGARTPAAVVSGLMDVLVDGDAAPAVRDALMAYATNGYDGNPDDFAGATDQFDRAVRGVAHLIMATPVYQMA
ncbi:MAG: DUF1800 family protein [Chloroflexi bacterium]|nr:DUF1800 family protein [Chloroflexota bacterium]